MVGEKDVPTCKILKDFKSAVSGQPESWKLTSIKESTAHQLIKYQEVSNEKVSMAGSLYDVLHIYGLTSPCLRNIAHRAKMVRSICIQDYDTVREGTVNRSMDH